MNIDISIANTLKKSRKEHGYSLKEVAEMVGRSDKSVSSWETGRTQPDIPTLIKLCEIYNIKSFDSFLDRKSVARSSSVDSLFQHLTDNYNRMNAAGREKLVSLSDDLAANPANTADEPRIKLQIAAEGGLRDEEIPRVTQSAIDESENEMLRLKIRESLGLTPEEYREEYGDEGE